MTSRILAAYYRGPDHPMKLRLWRWCRTLAGYPRLTVPYGGGGWITVDERDWLQGRILAEGGYEREVWDALSAFAAEDECVWDVGAHIGSVAVCALLDPRVQEVHAFEPDARHSAALRINLALNRGRFTQHLVALSDRAERRRLFIGPSSNTGLSSLAGGGAALEVECRTADELVFRDGVTAPTLLKIDVEGWEGRVLRGARRLLSEQPPKAVVLECAAGKGGEIQESGVAEHLERRGYRLAWIKRPSGVVEARENFLAVRE